MTKYCGVDLRRGYFSVKKYAKAKNWVPKGECAGKSPLDPTMVKDTRHMYTFNPKIQIKLNCIIDIQFYLLSSTHQIM